MKLPGLSDIHVHMREPGATHKEDWDSGTAAALAGGITTVLAMPNTQPTITNSETLIQTLKSADEKAHCDYAQYLGAGPKNAKCISHLANKSAGLKMYLDNTYGNLRLDKLPLWMKHFEQWPKDSPIAIHAEGKTLAAAILLAHLFDRHIHICHVSRKEEILLIRASKERGIKVTCEVCPHHLFLTEKDIPHIGSGRSDVRPTLAHPSDRDALWENMEIIDCFATDHAPHTLDEKDSDDSPPGFPGLETMLPLLLTAVKERRIEIDDLVERLHTNPQRIFTIPEQSETHIEIDTETSWEIRGKDIQSRAKWSPFEDWKVHGRVVRVILRGEVVYQNGNVLAAPGTGRNIKN
jgi:carbamoyl-phosphate synthase/aspartate carbamoyltransferase/dihydroorotase